MKFSLTRHAKMLLVFLASIAFPGNAQCMQDDPGVDPPVFIAPKVTDIKAVYRKEPDSEEIAAEEDKEVALYPGNIVRFTITNPLAFLNTRPSDKSKVVLYVNGIEMEGVSSDWMSRITREMINSGQVPKLGDSALIYMPLKRIESTQAAWRYFYGNSNHFYDHYADLDASIGWEGMSELAKASNVPDITIIFFRKIVFWSWLGLFAVVIVIFVYIAFFTDALRDGGVGRAYSLSLTQLLFWTALVIAAFIYTLVLTDITTSFNTSILLLLGISAGTTGFAYLIDTNYAEKNANAPQKAHKAFLKDILSDGTGFSVQRIQVVAWNLVLGLYFIIYTLTNKSMPEFSPTLLFLAGVSSASYLSAKGPEHVNATKAVAAAGNLPPGGPAPPAN